MAPRREAQISCKLIGPPQALLAKNGIPVERAYAGLPFTAEFASNPRNKIPWSHLVQFLRNVERELGGPERLENATDQVHDLPGNELMISVARYFAEVTQMYWSCAKLARVQFPCVTGSYERIEGGRVRLSLRIDEDHEDSPQFFRVWRNGMRTIPAMLGLPNSRVEMEIQPRMAIFTITPPPSRTLVSRARSFASAFVAPRAVISELTQRNEEMERYYRELLDTQLKLQEQERKSALSAQLAALSNLAALGEMAAGISHEINNPLMILYLQAGLLRRRISNAAIDGATQTELLAILQEIESSGTRISTITRSLLAFAGETHNEKPEQVTLCEIVRDAMQLCGEKLKNAGIRIEAPPPTPVKVRCQRAQLSHAFVNLVNNSYEALQTKPKSERWIRIEYTLAEAEGEIFIAVTDNGPGIAPDKRDRIFEPFYTTRGVGKATGLGLSVSKGLVDANGGRLVLDETSPHTRFVIRLPATVIDCGDCPADSAADCPAQTDKEKEPCT
jgi:signal transduction histidine kinase